MAGEADRLANRRRRTRKDLLQAAARLLGEGGSPSMEEVAAAALVSRATAYRYFPNVEALLVEAAIDHAVPGAAAIFAGDESADVVARVDRAEAALHAMTFANEVPLRLMLAHAIQRAAREGDAVPLRQNRRMPLIEAALAPARARLGERGHARLSAALAVFFGPEAMVVFRDVLRSDAAWAREVKSWAVRALVRAALEEAEGAPRLARLRASR